MGWKGEHDKGEWRVEDELLPSLRCKWTVYSIKYQTPPTRANNNRIRLHKVENRLLHAELISPKPRKVTNYIANCL